MIASVIALINTDIQSLVFGADDLHNVMNFDNKWFVVGHDFGGKFLHFITW